MELLINPLSLFLTVGKCDQFFHASAFMTSLSWRIVAGKYELNKPFLPSVVFLGFFIPAVGKETKTPAQESCCLCWKDSR